MRREKKGGASQGNGIKRYKQTIAYEIDKQQGHCIKWEIIAIILT